MKEEIWKDIVGFEGKYQVSNIGNVRSLNYKKSGVTKLLSLSKTPAGYPKVGLVDNNGETKSFMVHRLVLETFEPIHDGLPCCNHINEIKDDNRLENLEWVTYKYNLEYSGNIEKSWKRSYELESWKKANEATRKPIIQLTVDGEFVAEYISVADASIKTGINKGSISHVLNGRNKVAGVGKDRKGKGFIFKYK